MPVLVWRLHTHSLSEDVSTVCDRSSDLQGLECARDPQSESPDARRSDTSDHQPTHGSFAALPTSIVEEHNQALPYWRAVRAEREAAGFLLHFDAHADFSTPEQSHEDSDFGMSDNDEFIVASIMEGVVDRFIWVWPSWDRSGPEHWKRPDAIATVYAIDVGVNESDNLPCYNRTDVVQVTRSLALLSSGWEEAAQLSRTVVDSSEIEPNTVCRPLKSVVRVDVDQANLADISEWFPSLMSGWGILDVDLDFFGQLRLQSVLKVDRRVKRAVRRFSCARDGVTEDLLDTTLRRFVADSIHALHRNESQPELGWAARMSICPGVAGDAGEQLFHAFKTATTLLTLQAFLGEGFCFNTTPQNHGQPLVLGVCVETVESSRDTNMESAAKFLADDPVTIDVRLRHFVQALALLEQYARHMHIVTICRSVRDGYTPRRSWAQVERGVLAALGSQHLTHNPFLLGGPGGWDTWKAKGASLMEDV